MPIKATRTLLTGSTFNGSLSDAKFRTDANFGFEVPVEVAGVDPEILTPRETWAEQRRL
jgi:phosphoenolpyruvate carboxykinase (ATP)